MFVFSSIGYGIVAQIWREICWLAVLQTTGWGRCPVAVCGFMVVTSQMDDARLIFVTILPVGRMPKDLFWTVALHIRYKFKKCDSLRRKPWICVRWGEMSEQAPNQMTTSWRSVSTLKAKLKSLLKEIWNMKINKCINVLIDDYKPTAILK